MSNCPQWVLLYSVDCMDTSMYLKVIQISEEKYRREGLHLQCSHGWLRSPPGVHRGVTAVGNALLPANTLVLHLFGHKQEQSALTIPIFARVWSLWEAVYRRNLSLDYWIINGKHLLLLIGERVRKYHAAFVWELQWLEARYFWLDTTNILGLKTSVVAVTCRKLMSFSGSGEELDNVSSLPLNLVFHPTVPRKWSAWSSAPANLGFYIIQDLNGIDSSCHTSHNSGILQRIPKCDSSVPSQFKLWKMHWLKGTRIVEIEGIGVFIVKERGESLLEVKGRDRG